MSLKVLKPWKSSRGRVFYRHTFVYYDQNIPHPKYYWLGSVGAYDEYVQIWNSPPSLTMNNDMSIFLRGRTLKELQDYADNHFIKEGWYLL